MVDHIFRGPASRTSTDCSAASLQLVDLGEPAYSKGSRKGCNPQQKLCPSECGHRGSCVGGFHHPRCDCDPGWTGPQCDTATIPSTLGPSSYARLALSFTQQSHVAKVQMRLRTRNVVNFQLLQLSIVQPPGSFTLHVRPFQSSQAASLVLFSLCN